MTALSKTMKATLRKLAKGDAAAHELGCSISTLMALSDRKLIRVETTFDSIAFPRQARATITPAGRAILSRLSLPSEAER